MRIFDFIVRCRHVIQEQERRIFHMLSKINWRFEKMDDFKRDLQSLNVGEYNAGEMMPMAAQTPYAQPYDAEAARLCIGLCIGFGGGFCVGFCSCFRCNCFNCFNCFRCHNCFRCGHCGRCG